MHGISDKHNMDSAVISMIIESEVVNILPWDLSYRYQSEGLIYAYTVLA